MASSNVYDRNNSTKIGKRILMTQKWELLLPPQIQLKMKWDKYDTKPMFIQQRRILILCRIVNDSFSGTRFLTSIIGPMYFKSNEIEQCYTSFIIWVKCINIPRYWTLMTETSKLWWQSWHMLSPRLQTRSLQKWVYIACSRQLGP